MVCDAYSGSCVIPTPVIVEPTRETATSVQQPAALPYTGIVMGELLMISLLVLIVGILMVRLFKKA